jgi:regulatory protein
MPKEQKYISRTDAIIKVASYCAYQERCHNEVKAKLADLGFYGEEANEIMLQMIEQNYLNEERFAKAYAGGKFRVKKWGKLKIKRELKARAISDYCIQLGLKEIDGDLYLLTLQNLAQDKMESLKTKNPFEVKHKVYLYLATRGYESDLIADCLNALLHLKSNEIEERTKL